MDSRASKPAFQSVVDLGLRDVGVESDPRRHAAYLGKTVLRLFPLAFMSFMGLCLVVTKTGAPAWRPGWARTSCFSRGRSGAGP
jgi:hypothetical protein